MLKMLREKVLVSLVVVLLVAVTIGNVVSLATEPTVTINPTTGNNVGVTITTDNNKNTNANTNSNTNSNTNTNSLSATVGAANTNKANTNTNKAANTNKANTNTNKASKLPYAGADSSLVVVVIALAASAVYAYKKVSDYNI